MSGSDDFGTLAALGGADVAILGVGREGQSVWRRLRERRPGRVLTLYSEGEIESSFARQLDPGRDRVVVGPFDGEALGAHDWLVRSPGVSPYREALVAARAAGARFTSATSLWFAEHPDARTICISGTKGKSTTTALVARLSEACGLRTVAAGNIGRPLFDVDAGGVDVWVIELSSYQLADLEATPRSSLLLNLSDEHLDWHGGAERYRRDKLRLAELTPAGRLVANHRDIGLRHAFEGRDGMSWFNDAGGDRAEDGGVRRRTGGLLVRPPASLPGRHNLDNLAGALAVARLAGVLPDDPQGAIEDFRGLPHRLNRLGELDGLCYVDDSLSTTPVATLAALDAHRDRPVALLVGGLDRGLDWNVYLDRFIERQPHAIIGMPDSGAAIIGALADGGLDCAAGLHVVENMTEAVALARRVTPRPGTVLLSPGAPSFPRYRDYRDRGLDFARQAGFDVA